MITGMIYDGGRLVFLQGDPAIEAERPWEPVARIAASLLAGSGSHAARTASDVAWWVHNLVVLTFLNLLPLSKHFHVITAIPNVFFSKLEPAGQISKQDLDFDSDDAIFGTSQMRHFDWKQVLDMFSNFAPESKDYGLTERETEVLEQMVGGLTKKEIADQLNLSFHTVDKHIRGIYSKLHVNTMTGAVAKALKEGLLPKG